MSENLFEALHEPRIPRDAARSTLGYEPCKHNKGSVPLSLPTQHPSTLKEELLPQSLKYLTFIVDKLHMSRNGDDYFI